MLDKQCLIIHNLVCKQHTSMAASCLSSLYKFMSEDFMLVLHDDGSLDDEDISILSKKLPDVQIIRRKYADNLLAEFLSRYPMLKKIREILPYFLKIIDINLIKSNDLTCFVDSDVLFFRPFYGAFTLPNSHVDAIFMKDIANCYGIRAQYFYPIGSARLVARLNSGMFCIKQSTVDFDWLEWICTHNELEYIIRLGGWFEQGIWSAFAHRANCRIYDPTQILTAEADSIPDNPVALHFNGTSRDKLIKYLDKEYTFSSETQHIRSIKSSEYSIIHYLYDAFKFRLRL